MEDTSKQNEYYEYLAKTYPIVQRYQSLLEQIQDVIEALQISEVVQVNKDLLGQVVLDYFEDIDKLKKYEGIERVNVDKIYSYETYWLLKRKPLQIIGNTKGENLIFINEKIFTFLFIVKILTESKIKRKQENERLAIFFELIYYNFKYRIYTQKSLEAIVSAFLCGKSFR